MVPNGLLIAKKKLVSYMSQGVSHTHLIPLSEEREQTTNSAELRQSKMTSEVWNLIRLGFNSWWRHHPANIAIAITTPLLHRYAEKKTSSVAHNFSECWHCGSSFKTVALSFNRRIGIGNFEVF